jgi:amino acid transporter
MNHKRNVPDNAVCLTSIAAGILCLVNLGSTFAFNIIVSLTLLALLSTYMISIGCVLLKRLIGEELPPARGFLAGLEFLSMLSPFSTLDLSLSSAASRQQFQLQLR